MYKWFEKDVHPAFTEYNLQDIVDSRVSHGVIPLQSQFVQLGTTHHYE